MGCFCNAKVKQSQQLPMSEFQQSGQEPTLSRQAIEGEPWVPGVLCARKAALIWVLWSQRGIQSTQDSSGACCWSHRHGCPSDSCCSSSCRSCTETAEHRHVVNISAHSKAITDISRMNHLHFMFTCPKARKALCRTFMGPCHLPYLSNKTRACMRCLTAAAAVN
jgi:hypothetical protein